MMSRTVSPDFRKALWLFLILQSFYQFSLCEDHVLLCKGSKSTEKSFHVLNGRHFSLSILQEDPILSTQSLVWTKGESTWEKRHNGTLEFTGGNVSFDVTRYDLIEDTNGTLTLIISFVESNDMGKHVISIHIGAQNLCTVFVLNLTVESSEPSCLTIFDKKKNKLQMTCQWVQVIEGEQAHLVDNGNHVIYESSIKHMNFDRRFNLTNKFSVYVDSGQIYDGRTLPDKCIISHPNRERVKTCKFSPVKRYTIQNDKTKNVTFQCCTTNNNIFFT